MRIGIYDPYLDTLGGGEKYMLYIAKFLAEKNEVVFFWNDKTIFGQAESKFGIDLSKVKVKSNIFSKDTPIYKRLFESRKYDAIVYLSDGSIPFLFSRKLYLHFQFPTEWVSVESQKNKFKLTKVTDYICNSEFTKKYIDKKYGIKSKVLYPPVDVRFDKKIKKENIILHVGRFSGNNIEGDDYKKQSVMIEVFKSMINEGLAGWRFVIVASLKEDQQLRFEKLREQSEGYPIELVVNPDSKKIWENYSKAKIYWHATGFGEDIVSHPELVEHFGISTCEAMGAYCVPVVINTGGQKEIVVDGKNGYLWDDLEELKRKTLSLTRNSKKREKFAVLASRSVKKFGVERFAKELKQIVR